MTSTVATGHLLRYECRRVLRAPVVWLVLALLLLVGTWGVLSTARLHAEQAADMRRMAEEEAAWYADIRLRAVRYGQTSSAAVPYWQDPTGASGFSRYFLRRLATKPHLPLSALAVGQSDLQPFAVPLRLETLFGGDRVYDYEPPRALATGRFDLSFVLVFILPICLGAAAAALGAQERDQGILPFVAAQPISPQRWWSVRLGALAIVLVPSVTVCVVLALAAAGVSVLDAPSEMLAAVALVAAHTLLWLTVAAWCLVRGYGAVATTSSIAAAWLLFTVAVPLAASLTVSAAARAPSPVADVNELRRTTDDVQAAADTVVARRLIARLGPEVASINPASLDYSTRLVLITEELEERLADQERRRQQYASRSLSAAKVVSWFSPQVAFQAALADLAGTDSARHYEFLRAVRVFQLELRGFMYPRVLEPVRTLPRSACNGCPGRFTFTDYDAIPRFAMQDRSPALRSVSALRTAGWLGVLSALVAVVGIRRGRGWALGS